MMERGIGSYNWVSDYVGLPYEVAGRTKNGIDCWGLVCLVYRERLGFDLPDWVVDSDIDWEGSRGVWRPVESVTDYVLIRTRVGGNLPDHFAVAIAGGALGASRPHSSFVPLDQYMSRNPDSQLGVFDVGEDLLS